MLSVLSFRTVRDSQSDPFFIIQTVRNNHSFISNIVLVSQYSVIQYQIHHLLVIYISISVNSVFQNLIINTLMLSVFILSSQYHHEFSYSYLCMYVFSRSYQSALFMHINPLHLAYLTRILSTFSRTDAFVLWCFILCHTFRGTSSKVAVAL